MGNKAEISKEFPSGIKNMDWAAWFCGDSKKLEGYINPVLFVVEQRYISC